MKAIILLSALLYSLSAFSQGREQLLKEAGQLEADSNYGKAITIYNELLVTDSNDYEVYKKRGYLYESMKDYRTAMMDYSHSIHSNRRYFDAWARRAMLLARLGYLENSLKDYNTALPLADDKDMKLLVLVNRGEIKRELRQPEEAVVDFKQALQVDSNNLGVLADLGATLSMLQRQDEAIVYLTKAITIDSTFEGGYVNLAFLYANLGDYKKSLELNNRILRLKPNEAYALNNRGYAKMQLGDLEGALEDINNSILQAPQNSYAFRNRGLLYIKRNKPEEACADLHKALSLGFTQEYGDEVEELVKKNCQSRPGMRKM